MENARGIARIIALQFAPILPIIADAVHAHRIVPHNAPKPAAQDAQPNAPNRVVWDALRNAQNHAVWDAPRNAPNHVDQDVLILANRLQGKHVILVPTVAYNPVHTHAPNRVQIVVQILATQNATEFVLACVMGNVHLIAREVRLAHVALA